MQDAAVPARAAAAPAAGRPRSSRVGGAVLLALVALVAVVVGVLVTRGSDDDGGGCEDRGDGQGHEADDGPGELGAQHENLGQQHAREEDTGVRRPAKDQHGEQGAEAGVPGRDGEAVVLVDEAYPFEREIAGDEHGRRGGARKQRPCRQERAVNVPRQAQTGAIPLRERCGQDLRSAFATGLVRRYRI